MDLGIRGKVFALVGGVGGMGLDTARLLAAEGAGVALIGRNRERGRATSKGDVGGIRIGRADDRRRRHGEGSDG